MEYVKIKHLSDRRTGQYQVFSNLYTNKCKHFMTYLPRCRKKKRLFCSCWQIQVLAKCASNFDNGDIRTAFAGSLSCYRGLWADGSERGRV